MVATHVRVYGNIIKPAQVIWSYIWHVNTTEWALAFCVGPIPPVIICAVFSLPMLQ